jgi:ATP-binding cassette subfamily F protein 3
MGYYAQNQEDALDRNLTVFETLDNIAVGDIRTKLRDILAQFLFRGEDIDKKVSVLSGGERARLGMARFMLQPYNLLALDEPTNHMDIKSKDILKQALKAYDGTLIVVSHDRDFLDGLVDKMYEFRDGKVKEHVGSVAEFLEKRKIESLQELERRFGPSSQQSGEQAEVVEGKEKAKQAFQQRRSESKELRRMKHRVEFLEGEIGKVESVMKDIEKILSNPTASDDIMELTRTYLENKRELDRKTAEWTSLMEQIEESNF